MKIELDTVEVSALMNLLEVVNRLRGGYGEGGMSYNGHVTIVCEEYKEALKEITNKIQKNT